MIRIEKVTDIDTLLSWRREVICNVFGEKPSEILMNENREYYLQHVPAGSHIAFVAEFNREEAGCGSLCLTDELPSPDNPSGKCGYLMNIYVRENFREHGIAHAIVTRLIEEARARGCGKIYLETTGMGRPVYQSMGFKDLPDMMKL